MKLKPQHIFLILIAFVLLSACKSNSAFTRSMYGLTTKYNIHFNGKEAYKEGMKAMETADEEDYSHNMKLHPIYKLIGLKEPKTDANFDRAIEKCKKSVQTRSITNKPKGKKKDPKKNKEWMERGEWNPYIHNAWLLNGKALFHKGDFSGAQATFAYTARHFKWKPMLISECHIWTARCHAVQGFTYEAEAELNLVISAKKYKNQSELSELPEYQALTPQLQREFSLAQAEILLQKGEDRKATIEYLQTANKAWQTKEQKLRTLFIIAHLYEQEGELEKAYNVYGKIVSRASNYKTQFNARIAQTRVMPTDNLAKIESKLNSYRRQKRNVEYLDQVYYALGNVALMQKDTATAIARYELAIEKSKRNGLDKGIAALKLGEVTFAQEDYVKAQKAYSTAMSIIKDDYPDYKTIQRLSAVLDELQIHAETVQLQDSLLHLASLSEDERNKVIEKIIKDLVKAEKEATDAEALAQYNEKTAMNADPLAQDNTQPIVGEKDNSWYFYNQAVVNAGKTEFQRLWGSRRPEDDWRRRNKTEVFVASEESDDEQLEQDAEDGVEQKEEQVDNPEINEDVSDPHKKEYYLAQIPFSPEQQANANSLIENGMYNMGVIINEKLENLPVAIRTFERLETRYPETDYRLEMYYSTYLMSMRLGDTSKAEIYRQKLINTFPESAYALAISNPNYIQNLRYMSVAEDSLYIATYHAYLNNSSDSVHTNYEWVHDNWPLTKLMPKFLFLHALSFVQEGDIDAFRQNLEQLTALYPNSDVSPLAGQMVKGIHEGRNVQAGTTPKGMEWKSSLRRSGDESIADSIVNFIDDDNLPHILLLAYNNDSISQNDLLFEVAKFNFENYLVKDFDLEIIDTGTLSVLVISKFDNLDGLIEYHNRMDASPTLSLPDSIFMIDISEPNFRALLSGKTFDEYFQWVEETY